MIEAYQAFAGAVELVNNPVEDTPTLKVGPELGVNVGFRLIHCADVFDPDADETLFVKINWGDG